MKPCLLLALVLAPTLAAAQDFSAPPTISTTLDPVVVTAARAPQALANTLATTVLIERPQIEAAQATDVAELLRTVAGLDIGRTGGPGQPTSVFTRGANSNQTLVLIDGVRVNPGSAGGAALPNLAPEMIERIEIVEGPRSTLYGSDAIGGVINIITRAPQPRHVDASFRYGTYGTYDGSAAYADKLGDYGLAISTEQQHVDGFAACADASLDRGFRNSTVSARGTADFGSTHLEARAWNAQGKTEYFDSCSPDFGLNPVASEFRNQILALSGSAQPLPGWTSTLTASRGEDRVRQYTVDDTAVPPAQDFVRTLRPALDWQNTLQLGAHDRLLFGADGAQERVDSLSFGSAYAENTEQYGGFVENLADFGPLHALVAGRGLHDSRFGGRFTWNTELGYDVFTHAQTKTTLIAAAGTGFRRPNSDDRFGFGGNPGLRPEQSRNYEVGLKQTLGAGQSLDLRAFRNSTTDLIQVEFDPSNDPNVSFGYKAVNIDRARTEGVQAMYRYEDALWSARLGAILQNPEDRSPGALDAELLRRARRSITAALTRRLGAFDLASDVLATSSRADIDAATSAPVTDRPYVLWNLGAGYRFLRDFQIAARVENLLDRDYQTAAGYRQAGRSAYLTVRYGAAL